jgi:hypothetical protein
VSLKIKLIIAIQSVTIMGLLGVIMWLVYTQIPHEAEEASLNVVDGQISADYIDEKANYRVSGNKIYLDMPGVGQMWLPVLSDVPACERNQSGYVSRNGQMFYLEGEKITSELGIDVSSYQGEIDWDKVKAAGVDARLHVADKMDHVYPLWPCPEDQKARTEISSILLH